MKDFIIHQIKILNIRKMNADPSFFLFDCQFFSFKVKSEIFLQDRKAICNSMPQLKTLLNLKFSDLTDKLTKNEVFLYPVVRHCI